MRAGQNSSAIFTIISRTASSSTPLRWFGMRQGAAIVPRKTWDEVHEKMQLAQRQQATRWTHTHLLKGKLRTFEDSSMSPWTVRKPARGVRAAQTIRYYVSQKALKRGYSTCPIKSLNAGYLEDLVRGIVSDFVGRSTGRRWAFDEASIADQRLRDVVARVGVAPDRLTIELQASRLEELAVGLQPIAEHEPHVPACRFVPEVGERGGLIALSVMVRLKRLDGRRVLLSPDGHDLLAFAGTGAGANHSKESLVAALAQGLCWHDELATSGEGVRPFVRRTGHSKSRVHALLTLAHLGPAVIRAVLTGRHPATMTLADLIAAARHLDWQRQVQMLRIEA